MREKDYSHGELKSMTSDKRVMENSFYVVPFIFFFLTVMGIRSFAALSFDVKVHLT